jgi:hypothetical protein
MLLSEVLGVEPGSVIQYADLGRAYMHAVAIKKSSREKPVGFQGHGHPQV